MGLLSFLGLAPKAMDIAEKSADGLISGIDKAWFTAEEQADYRQNSAKMYLEHQKITLSENTARSITRRYLAVMIIAVFLGLLVFSVTIYRIDPEWSRFSLEVAGQLSWGFGSIIIFYYGYYAAGNLMDKRKKE